MIMGDIQDVMSSPMLRPDALPRGRFAVHLRRHHKLGVHYTILTDALSLINDIVSLPIVRRVHLHALSAQPCSRCRLRITVDRHLVRLRFSFGIRRQLFTIEARSPNETASVVNRLIQLAMESDIEFHIKDKANEEP